GKIAVLATVASTLGPTCRLLEAKARAAGTPVALTPRLCDGAFDLLLAGDTDAHDRMVSDAVRAAAQEHDVVVFAQASMARLGPRVQKEISVPLLSSPRLALARVAEMLALPRR